MANSSILRTAAMFLAFLATFPAQSRSFDIANAADSPSGFRTDRLTPKQLQIWGEIEKIALAADKGGRLLHPRLHGLWQRIQASGHTVFIEMMERRAPTCMGGKTTLEKTDLDGNRKVVVIWLHLWAMDKALADQVVRRSDGLTPYYRLGKYERYAEALGHELAHAVLMLENPGYAYLCSEYRSESAELLVLLGQGRGAAEEEIMQRRHRLQSLADRIEKPAEAAELEIWSELRSGQHRGTRASSVAQDNGARLLTDQ
jgi:hypothetical protein